jgi:type IX secretion system substrate protein
VRQAKPYLYKSTQSGTKLIKTAIASMAFLFIGLAGVQAQQVVTTTGGEASGSGGKVSYAVGQVFYTTSTGINGSIAAGVLQAYVISTILGIEHSTIRLSLYPNPTTDILNLKIGNYGNNKMSYQLYDQQGKLLVERQMASDSAIIKMAGLSSSTYILKVAVGQATVKVFRIVKN